MSEVNSGWVGAGVVCVVGIGSAIVCCTSPRYRSLRLAGQTRRRTAEGEAPARPLPAVYAHRAGFGDVRHVMVPLTLVHAGAPPQPFVNSPAPAAQFDARNLYSFVVGEKDKDENCPICLGPLHEEKVSLCPCLHLTHTTCLAAWLAKDLSCPVCRVPFEDPLETGDETGDVSVSGFAAVSDSPADTPASSPAPTDADTAPQTAADTDADTTQAEDDGDAAAPPQPDASATQQTIADAAPQAVGESAPQRAAGTAPPGDVGTSAAPPAQRQPLAP